MKTLITFIFTCSISILLAQPANDDCATAAAAPTDGSCVNGTTVNSNPSMAGGMNSIVACGTGQQGDDVWYSFTATDTYWEYSLTPDGTGDIGVVLFDDGCAAGTFGTLHTNCNSDGSTLTGSYNALVAGQTYYVLIISRPNQTQGFELCAENTTPPSGGTNNDCLNATTICSNATFSGNSNGSGNQELDATNQGCMSTEHESSWYIFTVETSGTFEMSITPQNGTDDYDFAIWGPNPASCPPGSAPIRCSYAAGGGSTGIAAMSSDVTEDAFGDRWVSTLNVNAGETYVLLIDNYSASTTPFDLTLPGTAGLDCTPLSVFFSSFEGHYAEGTNHLTWSTVSEKNNDYFVIERSVDGKNWFEINKVDGVGASNSNQVYKLIDRNFLETVNYYRVVSVNFDGERNNYKTISIDNSGTINQGIKRFSLMGQEVSKSYRGVVIIVYPDGTRTKILQ